LQALLALSQPNMHISVSFHPEPSGLQVCTAFVPHFFIPGLHIPVHAPFSQAY
jgi:hypothetical protein